MHVAYLALVSGSSLFAPPPAEPTPPASATATNSAKAEPPATEVAPTHNPPETPAPPATPPDEWKVSVAPYLWLAAMTGDITLRGRPFNVGVNLSQTVDLLSDHLNGAIALHGEASYGHFGLFADGMYMSLEGSRKSQLATQHLEIDEGIFELGFAWTDTQPEIKEGGAAQLRLEPLIGTRIWYLDGDARGSAGLINSSQTQAWADAFIGARLNFELSPCFSLFARGDLGAGGSDFTWNAFAGVEWNPCHEVGLIAGFRGLYVDYSDGTGTKEFGYDMLLWGPFMALEIRF